MRNPNRYIRPDAEWRRAFVISHSERASDKTLSHKGFDVVELAKGKLVKGQK